MKSLLSLVLLANLWLFSACKKDPPTLNEQLAGSWRVTFVFDAPNPDYLRNGLTFNNEGTNKGTALWGEHRDLDGTKDTVSGAYLLDEQASTMRIKWKNVTNPYGITKGMNYSLRLSQDTLILTWPDTLNTFIYTDIIKAVRD